MYSVRQRGFVSSFLIQPKGGRRSIVCMAFAAALAVYGIGLSSAHADEADEEGDQANVPVKERVHPELKAEGAYFGSLLFYPQLDARVLYDSNVFASTDAPEGDFVYVVAPKLVVQHNSDAQQHELTLAAKHMEFQRLDSETRTEADASLRSAWDIAEGLSLDSNLRAARRFEDRGDSLTANASTTPIGYYDLRATGFLTRKFNSLGISAGGGIRNLTYDDGETEAGIPLDQSFRDGTIVNAALRPFYEFSPGYRVFANLDVNRRDYAGEGLLDRDSQGFDARGGVEFLLSPLLFGSVEAGYLEQHYENPEIPVASGVSGKAAVKWLMTPLMTVSLFASRSVAEMASPDQSVRLDFVAGAGVDYEITRNLIASLGATYRNEDFTGIDRDDDIIDVDARLDYAPNQYFSFGLYYLYTDRDSNFDAFSFDRHRVMFNVSAKY